MTPDDKRTRIGMLTVSAVSTAVRLLARLLRTLAPNALRERAESLSFSTYDTYSDLPGDEQQTPHAR